jgi:hypothetical protein
VFAECAHPLAQFFSGAHGATPSHILAEAFAAATCATACTRKRAFDAAPPASPLRAHAATTPVIRQSQHAPLLVVLSDTHGDGATCPRAEFPAHRRQNEEQSEPDHEKLPHRNLLVMLNVSGTSESHITRRFV